VDVTTLIMDALTAGAGAALKDTVTQEAKASYTALKERVRRGFAGRPAGELALEQHEQQPAQDAPVLRAELVAAGVASDPAVVEAAQRLMMLLDSAGSQSGKYLVDTRGAQGVQVGDRNVQNISFGAPPPSA